jgi:DNA modification methylase
MKPYYQDKCWTILLGDSRELLPSLLDASAIVTDPPYELGFMGKDWDKQGVSFQKETWEVIRKSCKSGAPLLSFGGTRTFHRIACAIEDAGWEIRDTLMWVYAQGFPKSLNIHKQLQNKANCGNMEVDGVQRTESKAQYCLRLVPEANLQAGINIETEQGEVLQSGVSQQGLSQSGQASSPVWREQSSVEGGRDIEASEGELQRCQVCQMSEGILDNGTERWLCYGTPFGYGTASWTASPQDRSCPSYKPRTSRQQNRQPHAIPHEQGSQGIRGLIDQWEGYGTALKPAYEPIILAMNPLDGTFANNALKHGVAGLNIDDCRIPTDDNLDRNLGMVGNKFQAEGWGTKTVEMIGHPQGRFPSNFIHDGSQMVLELFPDSSSQPFRSKTTVGKRASTYNQDVFDYSGRGYNDNGSAARFFYTAKASFEEREKGLIGHIPCHKCGQLSSTEHQAIKDGIPQFSSDGKPIMEKCRRNTHPTVKALALMEYLVKLVKMPEYNLIIDPFMGSGTTLLACIRLGIPCIGIDNDEKTCEIAAKRCIESSYIFKEA